MITPVSLTIYMRSAIVIMLTCPFVHAEKRDDVEDRLTERGYELTEAGMREILNNQDVPVIAPCLKFIEREQFVGLLPDVKSYLESLEGSDYASETRRLRAIWCIIAIDKNMPQRTAEGYLERIRHNLYNEDTVRERPRSAPVSAYHALLAAQKYQGEDIYSDLVFLGSTNIMREGDYPFTTMKLFELYGDQVRESDIDTMIEAWRDSPKRQEFILGRVRDHGLLPEGDE